MLHWFDPGKYAAFVAGAYGISTVVLAALVLESLWRARHWRKAAQRDRAPPTSAKAKTDASVGAP